MESNFPTQTSDGLINQFSYWVFNRQFKFCSVLNPSNLASEIADLLTIASLQIPSKRVNTLILFSLWTFNFVPPFLRLVIYFCWFPVTFAFRTLDTKNITSQKSTKVLRSRLESSKKIHSSVIQVSVVILPSGCWYRCIWPFDFSQSCNYLYVFDAPLS